MRSVRKIFSYRQKSEGGFVLIFAIMAVMILMAVGFFILTTTTQDIRMSTRLVGEGKAFSAAESCIHSICATFNAGMGVLVNQPVDALNDPTVFFDFDAPVVNASLPASIPPGYGIESGKDWKSTNYNSRCTGRDTSYNSSVSIAIGVKERPRPGGPGYDEQ